MAWTNYQIFLALLMVVTGSINTLAVKWADDSTAPDRAGNIKKFSHPFLQACCMFFGEFLCFFAFQAMYRFYLSKDYTEEQMPDSVRGNKNFNPFIFLPPALCDMTATSLMYMGLNLTSPSSFQMLRGSLIIFTGLLSVTFLKRKLKLFHWTGMIFVLGGLIIVGLSDFIAHGTSGNLTQIITGDLLIVLAQIITATQMIVEEKFVAERNVSPLQAVGWEGFFGFTVLGVLLIPMYYIYIPDFQNPKGSSIQLENALDGLYQIFHGREIAIGMGGTIISIAFFNFAGISVTKQLSATTRTVLDSIRTLIIWAISLAFGLQDFSFIQLGGFIVLIIGMCIYNDIVFRPYLFVKIKALLNFSSDSERIIDDHEAQTDDIIS